MNICNENHNTYSISNKNKIEIKKSHLASTRQQLFICKRLNLLIAKFCDRHFNSFITQVFSPINMTENDYIDFSCHLDRISSYNFSRGKYILEIYVFFFFFLSLLRWKNVTYYPLYSISLLD